MKGIAFLSLFLLSALAVPFGSVFAQTERPAVKIISKGVINGVAFSLPKPEYPATARAVNAEGPVSVQVVLDEEGNVISATAVSGHPLLRAVSVEAAKRAKFKPTLLEGTPVKVRD